MKVKRLKKSLVLDVLPTTMLWIHYQQTMGIWMYYTSGLLKMNCWLVLLIEFYYDLDSGKLSIIFSLGSAALSR